MSENSKFDTINRNLLKTESAIWASFKVLFHATNSFGMWNSGNGFSKPLSLVSKLEKPCSTSSKPEKKAFSTRKT